MSFCGEPGSASGSLSDDSSGGGGGGACGGPGGGAPAAAAMLPGQRARRGGGGAGRPGRGGAGRGLGAACRAPCGPCAQPQTALRQSPPRPHRGDQTPDPLTVPAWFDF
jgi:hypothetical protein